MSTQTAKVRALSPIEHDRVSYQPGDVLSVAEAQAARLIQLGAAEAVDSFGTPHAEKSAAVAPLAAAPGNSPETPEPQLSEDADHPRRSKRRKG